MEEMKRDLIAVIGACGVLLYEMLVFDVGTIWTGIMVCAMLVALGHWLAVYGPAMV